MPLFILSQLKVFRRCYPTVFCSWIWPRAHCKHSFCRSGILIQQCSGLYMSAMPSKYPWPFVWIDFTSLFNHRCPVYSTGFLLLFVCMHSAMMAHFHHPCLLTCLFTFYENNFMQELSNFFSLQFLVVYRHSNEIFNIQQFLFNC